MLAVFGAATLAHLLVVSVSRRRREVGLLATNLGVVPVSVVPPWLVAGLVAGIIVVANLLAIGPGLAATRSKPAQLLRTR